MAGDSNQGPYDPPRRHPRVPKRIPILYRMKSGEEEQVTATINLSEGGMQFRACRDIPPGSELSIVAVLPGQIEDALTFHGVVRWARPDSESSTLFNVGVSFDADDPKMIPRLRRFIES